MQPFTYPSYEEPLLSAYEGRYECCYVLLHPFVRISAPAAASVISYPTDEQIASSGEKYKWRDVAMEANLQTYCEVNHGLLSLILALKDEFQNESAANAIRKVIDPDRSVWIPAAGCFPALLQPDILSAFEAAHSDEMVYVPEFPDAHPIQTLKITDLGNFGRATFPYRGTLLPADESFLFTVDWDSFFTLLYGPRSFVTKFVESPHPEGFFLTPSTRHHWWRESDSFILN